MIAYEIIEAEQASGKPRRVVAPDDTGAALRGLLDLAAARKKAAG